MPLGAEGQRRALLGLAQTNEDQVVLMHGKVKLVGWPTDPGFPVLDNRDAANPVKGERVVTWRATLPASLVLGNLATSVEVHSKGGVVVSEEFGKSPDRTVMGISKEPGKVLLVYVNEHIR